MKSTLRFQVFLVVSTTFAQIAWAYDLPKNIKLFVASPYEIDLGFSHSPESIEIDLIDFSLTERIESSLSENLSNNPVVAVQQATDRIENNLDELKRKLRAAVEAQILAEKFRIFQLPAAVIDNSIVVYGITDLDEILLIWRNSRNPS